MIKTFCFDLDGTLCHTEGMEYGRAVPIQEMIDYLNRLYMDGHRIVIDTARGSGTGEDWFSRTTMQLANWGVMYHKLRTGVKIPADVYIDDRSINPTSLR